MNQSEPLYIDPLEALLSKTPPPRGFRILPRTDDHLTITLNRSSAWRSSLLFSLSFIFMTAVSVRAWSALVSQRTSPAELNETSEIGEETSLASVLMSTALSLVSGYFAVHGIFTKSRFILSNSSLRATTALGPFLKTFVVSRDNVASLRQVEDSHDDDDAPTSWGLEVKLLASDRSGSRRHSFLGRLRNPGPHRALLKDLPYEHSAWLGETLSLWSGAPFQKSPTLSD